MQNLHIDVHNYKFKNTEKLYECVSTKKKKNHQNKETWPERCHRAKKKNILLTFQRTQVQYLGPISHGSQASVTLGLRTLTP